MNAKIIMTEPDLPHAALPNSLTLVVAGTGTEVGKTFVSRQLLCGLNTTGRRCLGLKPVETGFVDPATSDARALADAAGHELVPPYFTSRRAESPHRAARTESRAISVSAAADWVRGERYRVGPEVLLVETAGGLFTPLGHHEVNLDLVSALEPCVFVLVAPDRLGVLHDVRAAVLAARAVHRAPDVIWLNPRDPDAAVLGNAHELRCLPDLPPVIDGSLEPTTATSHRTLDSLLGFRAAAQASAR